MNNTSCLHKIQLAGQKKLSGEVLAARWHVQQCSTCQQILQNMWDYLLIPESVLPIVVDFPEVMAGDLRRIGDHVIGWFRHETQKITALAIRLGAVSPAVSLRPTTLGSATLGRKPEELDTIRRYESQTEDGSLRWEVTFRIDAINPDRCRATVQVDQFDTLDLSGTEVYLVWEDQQLQEQTDNQGQVHFTNIPIEALGRIDLLICPPMHQEQ